MTRILQPFRELIDFCYPRVCAACDGIDSDQELCASCLTELQKLETAPACDRCAMPLAQAGAPCPHCIGKGLKPFDKIVRLGIYQDPIKQLIHQVKYHGRWTLADFLGDRLAKLEPVIGLMYETEVIVPVPLHPWRQMSRGYNQAELIARRLKRDARGKLAQPVVRLRNTETQTHLHSKERRLENLQDAFGLLKPRVVRGKHVLVVDDVMTTGATLQSIGRTLMEAEPASLCAVVVAIADPKGRGFEAV